MHYIFKGSVFPKHTTHHFLSLMLIINPRTKRSYDQGDLVRVYDKVDLAVLVYLILRGQRKQGGEVNICFVYLRSLWKGWPGTPCVFEFEGPTKTTRENKEKKSIYVFEKGDLRGQRKQWGEINICFVYLSLWGMLTWYSLCIWGANDEEEGEEERRKVTVDHGPRSADRAPAGNYVVRK